MRDRQRERVYQAESNSGLWDDPKFETFEEVCEFAKECMQTKLVEQNYPKFMDHAPHGCKPGTIKWHLRSRNARRSTANIDGVNIAQTQFLKQVVLHELAHVIALRQYGWVNYEAHGWQWCAVYLNLVGWFHSIDRRDILREEFTKLGIQYTERPAVPLWQMVGVRCAA